MLLSLLSGICSGRKSENGKESYANTEKVRNVIKVW
jgi:hypothetical protein